MDIGIGVVLILLGVGAIALPIATSLAVLVVVGWALLAAGIAFLFSAFRAHVFGDAFVRALIGVAYIVVGVAITMHPLWGIASLGLVVAAAFVIEGIARIASYFTPADGLDRSFWTVVIGLFTLLVGFAVWQIASTTPAIVVSALVGINLIAGGVERIVVALALRRIQAVLRG